MGVKLINKCAPKVMMSSEAMNKMKEYIKQSNLEIGWLGCAQRMGKNYYIHDVFLFKQEVHSTTTEITTEGLSEFAMELMNQDNGVEIWNNMRVWGHSHVNMGTSPSGQDDKQMDLFLENSNDFFIRIIANKRDDFRIDVYDYEVGVIFESLDYEVMYDDTVTSAIETLKAQINILTYKLEKLTSPSDDMVKEIEGEIKEKVTEKKSTYVVNSYKPYNGYGYSDYGYSKKNTKSTRGLTAEEVFDKLTDEDIYTLAEHVEACGTSRDLLTMYDISYEESLELDDMVLTHSQANIVSYTDYLENGEIY